jgi:hypothetical protein
MVHSPDRRSVARGNDGRQVGDTGFCTTHIGVCHRCVDSIVGTSLTISGGHSGTVREGITVAPFFWINTSARQAAQVAIGSDTSTVLASYTFRNSKTFKVTQTQNVCFDILDSDNGGASFVTGSETVRWQPCHLSFDQYPEAVIKNFTN